MAKIRLNINGRELEGFSGQTILDVATENGILILNPGSISRPRSRIGATFAVIECADKLEIEFFGISAQGNISKLKSFLS